MDIILIKWLEYHLPENFKKACPEMFIGCHKDFQPIIQKSKGVINIIAL